MKVGAPHLVRALLDSGANVDGADEFGYTALIWAVSKGDLQVVRDLLAEGARSDSSGRSSNPHLVVRQKAHSTGHGGPNRAICIESARRTDSTRPNELVAALVEGKVDMVKLLLDYGTDANAQLVRGRFRSKEFDTVLHAGIWAQDWDKKSILPLLLANGADVDPWPRGTALNGGSPLMCAVQLGCATAITQLLKAGADPNVGSTKGYVLLHITVQTRDLDFI